jgi:hypothetical protein
MAAAQELPRLLADLPKGAWVALAQNEDRVVAYGDNLDDVVRRAQELGEKDPIVARVPPTDGIWLF